MLVIAVPILGMLLYFIQGSLEIYPTEEQQDKVKGVLSTLTLLLISIEIGLALLLVTFKHK